MQLAIHSFSYHRYFGLVYPGLEQPPGRRMTVEDFLARARELAVAGVSIDSWIMDDLSPSAVARLRAALDEAGLQRVWSWGHPAGLQCGDAPEQLPDLMRNTEIAAALGADVMRICCGGRRARGDWTAQRRRLMPLLKEAVAHARDCDVVLAIENHIDMYADELVEIVQEVDSPWLGVCLDTANNARMLEDPMQAIAKLAPYARTAHIKDVTAAGGDPREFTSWPSVPLGQGVIDIPRAFDVLRASGYAGLLALEIDYLHPAYGPDDAAVAQSIEFMRSVLAPD
jgi:sugar phosphate isomerase/epimerase